MKNLIKIVIPLFLMISMMTASVSIMADGGVYSSHTNPKEEIEDAIKAADNGGKNILLIFGADWCSWCNKLANFIKENKKVSGLLTEKYIVVKVDIGKWDTNLDLMKKYKARQKAGVPSLVVLDSKGKFLVFQETGSLEEGKGHSEEKVLIFLKKYLN